MELLAWPPGPPLELPLSGSLVLSLPAAAADLDSGAPVNPSDLDPEAPIDAPEQQQLLVRAVVGAGGDVVHVLVAPHEAKGSEYNPLHDEAEDVFNLACAGRGQSRVRPRPLACSVDSLRSALWRLRRRGEIDVDARSNARLDWKRGLVDVTQFSTDAGVEASPLPPMQSLQTLPPLPVFPSPAMSTPQLTLPNDAGALRRRRTENMAALKPLDFGGLDIPARTSSSACNTPRAAARAATDSLSRVRAHLYLGGAAAAGLPADELLAKRIRAVVNLAPDTVARGDLQGDYVSLHARDADGEDLLALLPDVLSTVQAAREADAAALVHCHRGVSRSAAAVVAVLMVEEGLGCAAALKEVRVTRLVAGPNAGFVRALQRLEEAMYGRGGRRVAVLGCLRKERQDGGGKEVLKEVKGEGRAALEDPFAVVVLERGNDAGIVAARGPLADRGRWRRALTLVRWMEQRDAGFAERHGRPLPPVLQLTQLHGESAAAKEVREALR